MKIKGQCQLCLAETELCHSHIYPEFFYKPMYDDKHRFIVRSNNSETPDRFKQKGLREYLLCSDCELRFSVYEKYAREVIYGGTQIYSAINGPELHLKGLDYTKFKLFLLSLIWRMGIAADQFFVEVELGPYKEILRSRLIKNDPGPDNEFGCFITGVKINGELGHWFLPPSKVKLEGRFCHRAVIGGLFFMFFITNQDFPQSARRHFVKADGTMILRADELTDISFLREEYFDLVKAKCVRELQST
jgi:hypothetical protein